jgi:steroid delta-isomerase-like uncharacterized protein
MKVKDVIAAYYSAFNRMDKESFLSLLTDDVEHHINQGKIEKGKDAFRDFLGVMDAHYQEKVVDLVILTSGDENRAAAEFVIEGVYKKSQDGLPKAHGQKYRIPVGAFFTLRGGKVARITNYYNLPDWIEQVSK